MGRPLPFRDLGAKALGHEDKLVRSEDVGDLNDIFKTNHLGHHSGQDPYEKDGPTDACHRGRGPDLKIPFFELQEVPGKYPDLANVHREGGRTILCLGIKFELRQVEVGLFSHTEYAGVVEFDAQHGTRSGLDAVAEMNRHSSRHLHGT